jgi:thiamine-phosphate pyrophosphorylase
MSTLHQGREEAIRELRRERVDAARLYFVCEARPQGKDPVPLLDAGLRGGVDILQLRDKEADDLKLIEAARAFRGAADAHGALFILNDRPDLVTACGADGVHVGQDDPPVAEARRLAGAGVLVGLSTHSADQVDAACVAEGDARPDQISVGPVWGTPTKEGRRATGLSLIEHAAVQATIPWFAIGGIDPSNVGEVVAAGAERVVVVRAIRDADDPEGAARELRSALPGDPDG